MGVAGTVTRCGGLVLLLMHAERIPGAFALVFSSAFSGSAAAGGFAGATIMMAMRYGIARGLFSNEAGLGSAPMVHATAETDHPVRQGLYGIFEVFVDTILICTTTGLVVLVSGAWDSGTTGAALSTTWPVGATEPSCIALRTRTSTGSMPSAAAPLSICDS